MAVGGVSSNYNYSYNGYSSMINSNSWVDKANAEAEQLKQTAESKKLPALPVPPAVPAAVK